MLDPIAKTKSASVGGAGFPFRGGTSALLYCGCPFL